MSCNCFGLFDWFRGRNSLDQTQAQEFATDNIRLFTYNSLRSATSDFHPSNRIGGGGFGVVYRTWKLKDEERLVDIVDPELSQFPEDEVMRFIKVALFCHPSSCTPKTYNEASGGNAFQKMCAPQSENCYLSQVLFTGGIGIPLATWALVLRRHHHLL